MSSPLVRRTGNPRFLIALTVATLLTAVLLSAPAHASSSLTVGVFDEMAEPVEQLAVTGIYPSHVTWQSFVVSSSDALDVENIRMTVTDLRDFEHGCLRPEVRAGDTTCGDGPDQGELSEQLAVHLAVGQTADAGDPTACEDLEDVTAGDVWLHDIEDTPLGAGVSPDPESEALCLILGLEFADRADNNLAMGDQSAFDLRIDVAGPNGVETAVLDASMSAPDMAGGPGADGRGGSLAATGFALIVWLASAIMAIIVGWRLTRRRDGVTGGPLGWGTQPIGHARQPAPDPRA